MNEVIIRISNDGTVNIERDNDGVKSFKQISPDSLMECINESLLRGGISSGLLPRNCLSFTGYDNGSRDIVLLHAEDKSDVLYYETEYKDFPIPRLIFGFSVSNEGRISGCRLGVIANEKNLKPTTPLFVYPFGNVNNNFNLCIGNNPLPKCESFHTLASLPYLILQFPNNNDRVQAANNKLKLEQRDLYELLKDKPTEFYYSDVLIPSGRTLRDFIAGS
jgi:hypothetical protein